MSDKEHKKIIDQYSSTWTTLSKHDKQEGGVQVNDFSTFVKEIKSKILSHQYDALKAVNRELIALYWEIGKSIVTKQEAFGWGKSVVKSLSEELHREFVGIKGFSVQNLWNMRQFFLQYRENEKLQPMVEKLAGQKMLLFFKNAKISWKENFIYE